MATGVIYLDVDDEITSAASRIRSVDGRRVAVVVPYGSRVATSRINFRLLARDALTHEKRLSVVAGDAATRALAASAGLPVFTTVGEYEASLEATGASSQAGDGVPSALGAAGAAGSTGAAGLAASAAGAAGVASGLAASATVVSPPAAKGPAATVIAPSTADAGAITGERTTPVRTAKPRPSPVGDPRMPEAGAAAGATSSPERAARPARRSIDRTPVLIALAVLALAMVVGGVAGYLLLPSATIAIRPRETTIGPVPFRVTASTTATEPDAVAGIVPAQVLDLGVEATNTFPATGKRVEEATATGTVRFLSFDFTDKNTLEKGFVVSTESGVKFRTDSPVTLDAAEFVPGKQPTIIPTSATVNVTAIDPGPAGNVAANTINVIPPLELGLEVNNPDPTAGGARTEFPRIKQGDVDAAVATLTEALGTAFAGRLADPALSGGATVFPETAVQGPPVFSQDLEALVGQEVATFDLGATATGAVTAVDAAPVQVIAEARLASSVDPGYLLVDGSSRITVDPAVVDAGTIAFPVVVTARQVQVLDPGALEAEILGKPLADARAILERYGTVDLVVWPDWVGTIPTMDSRVEVTVAEPVTIETPASEDPSPAASEVAP